MRYIGRENFRETPGESSPSRRITVDLPIADAVDTAAAYSINAVFIAGSVLSSPVGLISDLGVFLTSFIPRF
jgi:hypothetical protein